MTNSVEKNNDPLFSAKTKAKQIEEEQKLLHYFKLLT